MQGFVGWRPTRIPTMKADELRIGRHAQFREAGATFPFMFLVKRQQRPASAPRSLHRYRRRSLVDGERVSAEVVQKIRKSIKHRQDPAPNRRTDYLDVARPVTQ